MHCGTVDMPKVFLNRTKKIVGFRHLHACLFFRSTPSNPIENSISVGSTEVFTCNIFSLIESSTWLLTDYLSHWIIFTTSSFKTLIPWGTKQHYFSKCCLLNCCIKAILHPQDFMTSFFQLNPQTHMHTSLKKDYSLSPRVFWISSCLACSLVMRFLPSRNSFSFWNSKYKTFKLEHNCKIISTLMNKHCWEILFG